MASLEGHSTVVYKDTLYVFGGVDHQTGLLSNCTWSVRMADVIDGHPVSASRSQGGTAMLNLVQCRGHLPPPRCYHACTLRGPFMVVTGGETGTDEDARERRIVQLNQYHRAGLGVTGPEDVSLFDDDDDDVISNPSDDEGDDGNGGSPSRRGFGAPKSKASALVGRIKRGCVLYTLNLETLLWSRHHLRYSFESHDGWVLRTQQELKKLQAQQHAAATTQGHMGARPGGPRIDASNLIRLNQQISLEAGAGGGAGAHGNDDTAASLALAQATDTVLEAAGLSFTDMALAAVKRRCHATLLSCPETIYLFGGYPIEHAKDGGRGRGGLSAQTGLDGGYGDEGPIDGYGYGGMFPGGDRSAYDGTGGGLLKGATAIRSRRLKERPDGAEALAVEPSCFYRLFEVSGRVDVSAVDTIGSMPMLWGHSSVRCHNSIIVFGGVDARGGSETAALCVYSLEDRRWRWVDQHLTGGQTLGPASPIGAGGPTPRALHSAVLHRASMLVHGGFNTSDPSCASAGDGLQSSSYLMDSHMNDTWAFSLNTGQWELLVCSGDAPPPRSGHTSFMHEDLMVVVGGLETRLVPPQMDFPPPLSGGGHGNNRPLEEGVPSPGTIAVLDTYSRQWRVKAIATNVPMSEALRRFVPHSDRGDGIGGGAAGLLLNPFQIHGREVTGANQKELVQPAPSGIETVRPTHSHSVSPSPQAVRYAPSPQPVGTDSAAPPAGAVVMPSALFGGDTRGPSRAEEDHGENAEIFRMLRAEAAKVVPSARHSVEPSVVPASPQRQSAVSAAPSAAMSSVGPLRPPGVLEHDSARASRTASSMAFPRPPVIIEAGGVVPAVAPNPVHPAAPAVPSWARGPMAHSADRAPSSPTGAPAASKGVSELHAPKVSGGVGEKPKLSFKQFSTPARAAIPIQRAAAGLLDEDELPKAPAAVPPAPRPSSPRSSTAAATAPGTPTNGEERKARLREMRKRQSESTLDASFRSSPLSSRAQSFSAHMPGPQPHLGASAVSRGVAGSGDAVSLILSRIDEEEANHHRSSADAATLQEARSVPAVALERHREASRSQSRATTALGSVYRTASPLHPPEGKDEEVELSDDEGVGRGVPAGALPRPAAPPSAGGNSRSSSVHGGLTRRAPPRVMSHDDALGRARRGSASTSVGVDERTGTPTARRGGQRGGAPSAAPPPSERPEWNSSKSAARPSGKAAGPARASSTPKQIIRPRRGSDSVSTVDDGDARHSVTTPRRATTPRLAQSSRAGGGRAKASPRRVAAHAAGSDTTATDDYLAAKGIASADTDDDADGGAASATSNAARLLAEELAKLQRLQAQQQKKQVELQRRQRELMERLSPRSSRAVEAIVTPMPPHGGSSSVGGGGGGGGVAEVFDDEPRPPMAGRNSAQDLSAPTGHSAARPTHPMLYNPYRAAPPSDWAAPPPPPTTARAFPTHAGDQQYQRSVSPRDPYLRHTIGGGGLSDGSYSQQIPPPVASPSTPIHIDFHAGVSFPAHSRTPVGMQYGDGYQSDTVVPGQGIGRQSPIHGSHHAPAYSAHQAGGVQRGQAYHGDPRNIPTAPATPHRNSVVNGSVLGRSVTPINPKARNSPGRTSSPMRPGHAAAGDDASLIAARNNFLAAFK